MASTNVNVRLAWVTYVCAFALCVCTVFAGTEVRILPATNTIITLTASPPHVSSTYLLQGVGSYDAEGSPTSTLTYNFQSPVRLTRMELVTEQPISPAHTTHYIEMGINSINTFAFCFDGNRTAGSILTFNFPELLQVTKFLRILTTRSGGGANWASIAVWAMMEQVIPCPGPPATYYRAYASSYTSTGSPELLLRGTGAWDSGAVATPSSNVHLSIDLVQFIRFDQLKLVCSQQTTGLHTFWVMGGGDLNSITNPIFYHNAITSNNQVLTFNFTGTQYRFIRILSTESSGNIVRWKNFTLHSIRVNPEQQFYPYTWGAVTLYPSTISQYVPVPTGSVSATIMAYSGGGGASLLTGLGGSGAYASGYLTTTTDLEFVVGGIGSDGDLNPPTGFAFGGVSVHSGGAGGFRGNATVAGGGGGGGTTMIKSAGVNILVLGGGGGGGANVQGNAGGAGGAAGTTAANGNQGKGINPGTGGLGAQQGISAGGPGFHPGGGGGGGGLFGGKGGGATSPEGGGAGGGGAGSSGSFANFNGRIQPTGMGPLPGCMQIMFEYHPNTTIYSISLPATGSFIFGMNQGFTIPINLRYNIHIHTYDMPILWTIFGPAYFAGNKSSGISYVNPSNNMANSPEIYHFSRGTIMMIAQTASSAYGYRSLNWTFNIT